MTIKNRVTDALGVVGAFVAAHPEFDPQRIEGTVETIVEFLKQQKLDITVVNMEKAWTHIRKTVRSKSDVTTKKTEAEQIAEIYKLAAIIDGWSSVEMREHMKDPEIAAATENVLAERARLEAAKQQQPKPQPEPKAKFKPPVRTTEQQILEDMTADQFKAAVARRGSAIEKILSKEKAQ